MVCSNGWTLLAHGCPVWVGCIPYITEGPNCRRPLEFGPENLEKHKVLRTPLECSITLGLKLSFVSMSNARHAEVAGLTASGPGSPSSRQASGFAMFVYTHAVWDTVVFRACLFSFPFDGQLA